MLFQMSVNCAFDNIIILHQYKERFSCWESWHWINNVLGAKLYFVNNLQILGSKINEKQLLVTFDYKCSLINFKTSIQF